MSVPEYYQKAEDHQSILLLVKFLNLNSENVKDDEFSLNSLNSSNSNLDAKYDDLFNELHKELVNVNITKINGNLSYERTIRLRFKKNQYELSNNEWGDFQAHRKLFGLITIGILNSNNDQDNEIDELYDKHKQFADIYPTLLDSRCILLKINKLDKRSSNEDENEDSLSDKQNELKNTSLNNTNSFQTLDANDLINSTNDLITNQKDDKQDQSTLNKLTNCNVYDLNYDENKNEFHLNKLIDKLKQDLNDLVASLFFVLESKRLDKSYEKLDKVPLLLAPFENKSLVGLDTDSKAFKKKCMGRMRKHIGDLCLLVGSPSEALNNYSAAIDLLRPVSDLLWLSAALEGQCVASLNLLYPNQPLSNFVDLEQENQKMFKKQNSLKRIFSLPKFRYSISNQQSTPSANNVSIVTTPNANDFKPLNDLTPQQQIETNNNQNKLNNNDTPIVNNRSSAKTNLTIRFLSNTPTSNSLSKTNTANSLDPVMVKLLGKSLLSTDEEIYEKYKEACCHYAKFKMAAIVELECSLKATRVLAARDKFLQASEFIQNAAFISLETNPEKNIEKNMEKTCVIGQLYEKIGFRRKSAFYQRLTALQTISYRIEKLEKSNWEKCYYLLLPSIFGYHLSLDPLVYEKRVSERDIGWTSIHLQLLQELVTMSRKMGNDQLAMRHLSFILQALNEYLPNQLKSDLAKQLELLGSKCGEGAPVPLTLNNGFTIPSVNLTKFPLVTKFDVQSLNDNLKPIKMKTKRRESSSTSIPSSPFIFTPIQLNKSYNRRKSLGIGHIKTIDFQWVQNELCVVNIEVYNPLQIELKINHMALMTSGAVAFETKPISFSLPPESGPQLIKLTGKPLEAGKLEILGYTLHVLGVKNNCKLSELPYARRKRFPLKYIIEVIPQLPHLTCSILNDSTGEQSPQQQSNGLEMNEAKKDNLKPVHNIPVRLYAGESKNLNLKITNSSINNDQIELMNVKVISNLSKDLESKVIKFDSTETNNKLPLNVNSSIELKIDLYGAGDFILLKSKEDEQQPNSKQQLSASSFNTPTHKKSQATTLGSTLVNFLSDLQSTPKHTAKQTPAVKKVSSSPTSKFSNKKLQVTLEFEYTGSSGLTSGFCRQTRVNFQLEIMPSLLITKWDVLPAVQTNSCYLVFDVLNATLNEMEVFYSSNKAIIIESKDTCRFPVPVERCPLVNESINENPIPSKQEYNRHVKIKETLNDRIEKIVRNHLTKQVDLSWKITQNNTNKQTISGNITINEVPWSNKMLNSISMCCIQFEVLLNEVDTSAEQEFNHKLGELIKIKIKVLNWSSLELRSLTLMVECFQDYENGNRRYNLENKRGLMGSDRLYIDKIQSKNAIEHQLEFVFFYTGVYKIDIRCIRNQFQTDIEKDLLGDVSNDSNEWRCPTIELNIVE